MRSRLSFREDLLPLLTLAECVTFGDFLLHSGQKSDWIFDSLKLSYTQRKDVLWCLGIEGYRLLEKITVIGIELGGALIAYTDCVYPGLVRKDGTVYLPNSCDDKAILLDDVCTTGSTFKMAKRALQKEGITVTKCMCIINRGNYPCESLFTGDEIYEAALSLR